MRPGRLTPENPIGERPSFALQAPFNEAGAINPGKPALVQHMSGRNCVLQ